MNIFSGEFPKHVHLCVNRFEIGEIPGDKALANRWIRGSFLRKERLLKAFYENDFVPPTEKVPTKEDPRYYQPWPLWFQIPKFRLVPSSSYLLGIYALSMASYTSNVRWLFLALVVVCTVVKGDVMASMCLNCCYTEAWTLYQARTILLK